MRGVLGLKKGLVFLSCCISLTGGSLVRTASAEGKDGQLIFKGCGIIRAAFMSECAEAYKKKTGKDIRITGGGATIGVRAPMAGAADIGATCRPPLPGKFPEEEGGYLTMVAWDAICFITHPSNPVTSLTSQQAKDILTGKITNWNEVGGPDQRILVVYRSQTESDKSSGVGYMLRKLLFHDTDVDFVEDALHFRDTGLVEARIAEIEWTLGATGISSAKKKNLKILALDGIAPTKEAIQSGQYPLFRPLFIITKDKPHGDAGDFIRWLLSDEGQDIISSQGTVNLKEGRHLQETYAEWEGKERILNLK